MCYLHYCCLVVMGISRRLVEMVMKHEKIHKVSGTFMKNDCFWQPKSAENTFEFSFLAQIMSRIGIRNQSGSVSRILIRIDKIETKPNHRKVV